MVVDMWRYAVSLFIYVNNTAVRDTGWGKNMPSDEPLDDHFKKRR